MYRKTGTTLGLVVVVVLVLAAFAGASLARGVTVSKPALSTKPMMGVAFKVSGFTTPTAKKGVKVVVKIQVLMRMDDGSYMPMHAAYKATLVKRSGKPGYRYTRSITIPMTGKHAVQALRYRNGTLVGKSAIRYFTVS